MSYSSQLLQELTHQMVLVHVPVVQMVSQLWVRELHLQTIVQVGGLHFI